MFCYIALINIKNNIDTWERLLLIKNRLNNLSVAEKRLLDNYNVSNIEEYINLIKSNINDEESMSNIISKFNERKNMRLNLERKKEEKELNELLVNSKKIYKNDINIYIKIISELERDNAIKLFKKFKLSLEESIEDIENNIDDYILKNIIFGLFKNFELIGIAIIKHNRNFMINEKISTYYIESLMIDENYRNNGYGDLLLKYIILKCPSYYEYISLIISSNNIPMINLAKKNKFKSYENNVFIRLNDSIEKEINSLFL
jgi:ribosomal protein S18 acetylase RimI-like enzyme